MSCVTHQSIDRGDCSEQDGWRWPLVDVVLILAVVATSLALIYSSHTCRALYTKLQVLETNRWALEEDYSRLVLEQSTLANPHRVVIIARDELNMAPPKLDEVRVVESQVFK